MNNMHPTTADYAMSAAGDARRDIARLEKRVGVLVAVLEDVLLYGELPSHLVHRLANELRRAL